MSTKPIPKADPPENFVRLPDPPNPEDMNNWTYLLSLGNGAYLARHLGHHDTTIVTSEAYISQGPTSPRLGMMLPDLLVAFDVDPEACRNRNGYIISEQGKPPDFVLEIGSPTTGQRDVTQKRYGYAALGVREYWRFDPSGGRYQGAPLAGDKLVDGAYQPIPIQRTEAETHQGYSEVLNLHTRWEEGQLGWYDPGTGRHILRYQDQRDRADAAEARVRELEAELEHREQS